MCSHLYLLFMQNNYQTWYQTVKWGLVKSIDRLEWAGALPCLMYIVDAKIICKNHMWTPGPWCFRCHVHLVNLNKASEASYSFIMLNFWWHRGFLNGILKESFRSKTLVTLHINVWCKPMSMLLLHQSSLLAHCISICSTWDCHQQKYLNALVILWSSWIMFQQMLSPIPRGENLILL